ncbi:MAG: helix-turn-helix transcriptional regulator [Nakamurella sp.]
MASSTTDERQAAFSTAVALQLRQSRQRQHFTQSEVSTRTGGAISKAALANYETGHRSLRVEVFWALAKALGEDPGALFNAADRAVGYSIDGADGPVTVDIDEIMQSHDTRLAPVRRWFAMRLRASGARIAVRTIVLDGGAIAALAELMDVSHAECRDILAAASAPAVQTMSGSAHQVSPARTA